eukprot:CAMPEP_0114125402 /NCGR_PEP_ID=MMETSP0043_2-20121206/9283_1 /TAXON_ID=464988 /ORGANISM="Hemiselmis andersenii, Strain CCMP644" /LENGTH=142 /DNA_ID=CAMNT_0001218329 /DNA_START=1 /DNA_END=430 /DNA_ORIENTATION=+
MEGGLLVLCGPAPPARTGHGDNQGFGDAAEGSWEEPVAGGADEAFNEVDPSGEGSVDFQTFCRCMKMPLKGPDPESEVVQSFQAFDKNHSGMIAVSELTTVMRNFGEALTDDEVDEMMKAAGGCEAQPGQIDYRRFTKVLLG